MAVATTVAVSAHGWMSSGFITGRAVEEPVSPTLRDSNPEIVTVADPVEMSLLGCVLSPVMLDAVVAVAITTGVTSPAMDVDVTPLAWS